MLSLCYTGFKVILYAFLLLQMSSVLALDLYLLEQPDKRIFHIAQPDLSHLYIETLIKKVLIEAYQSIGIEVQFHPLPVLRSINLVNNGKLDAEFARNPIIEPGYANLVRVKTPIFIDKIVVYSHDKTFKIKSWEALKDYDSVILRGFLYVDSRLSGNQVSRVGTLEQVFKKVNGKRNKVAIDLRSNKCMLDQLELKNVHLMPGVLEQIKFYHYVHIKHKAVIKPLELAITKMFMSGRYRQLMRMANQQVKVRTHCSAL